jgi:hypothetical protein
MLIALTAGWYACNSELQRGFFIGAVVMFSLFFLFVLSDQYRFYNRRFKVTSRDSDRATASPQTDLGVLSLQLMDIRRQISLQQSAGSISSSGDRGGVKRFQGTSFDAAILEESKSMHSLNSLGKSAHGTVVSRALSRASSDNNSNIDGGEVSIMIRDMSHEYIVDSSSLSGVFLPSALSGEELSDNEDGSIKVEIVDHVSDSDSANNR